MPAGRSPALSGRRRSRKKGPATPSSGAPAQELRPLPPGTEIEARIDDDGFYGSWFEATVVGFEPAAGGGRRFSARYAVAYSHLVSQDDGPEPVAASHVRPRPPPPSPAPGFRLHDIVEAFDACGWWSGIVVVAPVPDLALADSGSTTVTVAFPITRDVLPFPTRLVRRRLDYVGGGEWVPSLSVVAVQPKHGARVYKAGEKVEVMREREAYGESWFPATVAKAVDRFSYIVEYLVDEQGDGGNATEYLHFRYIRPAKYHLLRESKVRLGPGTAVEVHCDGAWSQGVVRRVVKEGCDCEYEVSVNDEVVEQLLTKTADQLRPLCKWNGKHWTIPTDAKGQHNSRQQRASRKRPISPTEAACSDDEGLQCASVSESDATLPGSFKSVACKRCLNSCPLLSERSALSVLPHGTLDACSVSKNALLRSFSGHLAPPDELMPYVLGQTEGILSENVQNGNEVDEGSILQNLQNAGSSLCTSNILLSSFSSPGSSVPSNLALSQISDHQVPFHKRSPAWHAFDRMDVFKEVQQQPHFRTLREFLPAWREGMALGLMVSFASSVEDIRKLSITDSTASFEEKIATLRHLEENGFNVQFLQCRLDKLLQIKSEHTNYLAEKDQLKARLLEKRTSLSQIDERLEKKEQIIAELKEEAQKIIEEKELEEEELSKLKAADFSIEEACGGAELKFQSVLAELRHTSLT